MNIEDIKSALSGDVRTLESNLTTFVRDHVSPADIQAGARWYRTARAVAVGIARDASIPLPTAVALISALSPSNSWGSNIEDVNRVLAGFRAGLPADSLACSTYGPNVVKAYAILSARPSDPNVAVDLVGKGLKTRSFFWNIFDPSLAGPVTVDRHAVSAALNLYDPGLVGSVSLTPLRYGNVALAYTNVASQLGYLPHVLQGIVWVAWRRLHVSDHVTGSDPAGF